jgi:voltage-gated potassium channel
VELEAQANTHPRLKRVFGSVPGVRWLVGAFVAVALGAAIVVRLIASADFPTFGEALWWSIQTVTTVGYGDVAPETSEGRVVAGVLMIAGIASISLVTAAISAGFVRRQQERRSDSAEVRVLDALARIEARLDELEQRLPPATRD